MLNLMEQPTRTQYLSVAMIFLLLLVATPVAGQTVGVGDHSYSGDDAHDPAAGGLPALSVASSVSRSGSEIGSALSHGELEARGTWAVDGGFSGDDAYNPAAGGTPELSLLTFGLDLVACAPTTTTGKERESDPIKQTCQVEDNLTGLLLPQVRSFPSPSLWLVPADLDVHREPGMCEQRRDTLGAWGLRGCVSPRVGV